jgi:hypothetical protein
VNVADVYVLTGGYDYEGEIVLGVYSAEEGAKGRAKDLVKEGAYYDDFTVYAGEIDVEVDTVWYKRARELREEADAEDNEA